jgi:hypothetical protein
VYKAGLPGLGKKLEELRKDFAGLGPEGARWARLRIDPLISHTRTLEHLITSEEFSGESSRLRKGVVLFHSDLVYLRQNVLGLQKLLQSERRRLEKRGPST